MLSRIIGIALLMWVSILTAAAQTPTALPLNDADRVHLKPANCQLPWSSKAHSRSTQTATIDFDYTDSYYDTLHGGLYTRYIWSLNQNLADDAANSYELNWAATQYDTIIDGFSGTGYSITSTAFTLDSVVIPYVYVNKDVSANDSLTITVYKSYYGITLNPDNVDGAISDTILYSESAPVSVSTDGQAYQFTFYPELSFPTGGRFAIGINFTGNTVDTFFILAGGGNLCALDTCVASQSVAPNNAQFKCIDWNGVTDYTFTTATGSVFYDCNDDHVLDSGSCEFFFLQDIAMEANLTINTGTVTPLEVTLSSPDSNVDVCPGQSITLTSSPTGGTAPYHYSWGGAGVVSVNDSVTTGVVPATPTTGYQVYGVTVTDDFGLTATASDTFTVVGIGVSAGSNTTVSCGQTTTLTATVSGDQAGLTASWNGGAQGTTYEDAGPGIYSITVSNTDGCSATSSVQVSSNVNNTASFSNPTDGCLDSVIAFTNTSSWTNGWTWAWAFGDGAPNTSGANATHTYTSSNTYAITLTGDSGNCEIVSQNNIAISYCPPPPLSVAISGGTTLCGGAGTTLTATGSGGTGDYTYNWSTETSGSKINVDEGGPYSVTVTDGSHGTATASVTVTVLPSPTISISASNPLCSGAPDTLTSTVTHAGNSDTVNWFLNNFFVFSGPGYISSSFNPGDEVYATVLPSNGCTSSSSNTIVVPACGGPLSVYVSANVTICSGSRTDLLAQGGGGTGSYTYVWAPATGLSAVAIANPVANPTVTTTYVVTVYDGSDTTATDTVTVYVTPIPDANAGSNVTICNGGSATLDGSGGIDNAVYTWSPDEGLTCTTCQNPVANPTTVTTYTLTVTQGNNCSATAQVTVNVSSTAAASVTIVPEPLNACSDENIEFTALPVNGGSATYQWELNGQNTGTNSDTFTLAANNNSDLVLCQMISSLSCVTNDTVTSNTDSISICSGIDEVSIDQAVKLYPNPNNGQFILSINASYSHLTIDILNIEGMILQTEQVNNSQPLQKAYDLNTVSKGIYLFRITTENGTIVKRLVIQ